MKRFRFVGLTLAALVFSSISAQSAKQINGRLV
jgi:hypothetical protein